MERLEEQVCRCLVILLKMIGIREVAWMKEGDQSYLL